MKTFPLNGVPYKRNSNTSAIWFIRNKVNKKMYVLFNSWIEIAARLIYHSLSTNSFPNKYLQSDWNKYGENNFEAGILEEVGPVSCEWEYVKVRYAKIFRAMFKDSGYNVIRIPHESYNLAALKPTIAKEWNHERNGSLSPFEVTPGSYKYVWWRCDKGHEWQARIFSRSEGYGKCPYCAGRIVTPDNNLLTLFPALAEEWHPTKNGSLKPFMVVPRSSKKVWWFCAKGHEWQARLNDRSIAGNGCPICAGRKPRI